MWATTLGRGPSRSSVGPVVVIHATITAVSLPVVASWCDRLTLALYSAHALPHALHQHELMGLGFPVMADYSMSVAEF